MKKLFSILLLALASFVYAFGFSFNGGRFYFCNLEIGWQPDETNTYIQMFVGRDKWQDDYTSVYNMERIEHTQLYYLSLGEGWTSATYIRFALANYNSGYFGSGEEPPTSTSTYSGSYSFASGKMFRFKTTDSNEHPTIEPTYISSYDKFNSLHYTSAKVYNDLSDDGYQLSSTFLSKINLTTYNFSDYKTCGNKVQKEYSKGSSSANHSVTMGYTATTTYAVSDVDANYSFTGWYDADGNKLSEATTFTTNLHTQECTWYAYYKAKDVTVNVTVSTPDTNIGEVSTNAVTVTQFQSAELTATPKYGYKLVTWTLTGGAKLYSGNLTDKTITIYGDKTNDTGVGTAVATFEPDYSTGYYLFGSYDSWEEGSEFIKPEGHHTEYVGETTLSLAANTTYTIKVRKGSDTWYGNNGYVGSSVSGWTMNTSEGDLHIHTSKAGNYTFSFNVNDKKLSITYPDQQNQTVYFVNAPGWTTPYAYVWLKDKDNNSFHYYAYAGEPMQETSETATSYNFKVYSYTFPEQYSKIQFNCGANTGKTDDLEVQTGQYYDFISKAWYASAAEVPEPETVILKFVNNKGWSSVKLLYYIGEETWPNISATKESDQFLGMDVYQVTTIKGLFSKYKFCSGDDLSKTTNELTYTEGKTNYYKSNLYATLEEIVPALCGSFNEWSTTANQFVFEGSVGTTTIELNADASKTFKVLDGVYYGNNGTMTGTCTWTMHMSQGNCTITAKNKGTYTFSYDVSKNELTVTYPDYQSGYNLLRIRGEETEEFDLTKNGDKEEYYHNSLSLRTGDKVRFRNMYTLVDFDANYIDGSASMEVASITDNVLTINESCVTNFYLLPASGGNNHVQLQYGYYIIDENADNAFLDKKTYTTLGLMRPLSSAYMNTLCLPFSLTEEQINDVYPGATVAKLSSAEVTPVEGSYNVYIKFTKVKSIEAGMPYIIQPADDVTEPITFTDIEVEYTFSDDGQTQAGTPISAVGVLKPASLTANASNIFMGANNKLYYPSAAGTIKTMRAYFLINPETPSAQLCGYSPAGLKAFPILMSIEDSEEGVTEAVEASGETSIKPYKLFTEDNGIVIVIDGVMYNLAGQPIVK